VVRRLDTISDPHSQLRAPVVDEIMGWLDRNCLDSTQPLSAFVDAAQKSGNDAAAKELRIRRATKELTLRAKRIIGADRKADCDPAPKPAAPAQQSVLSSGILGFINLLSDAVAILFGGMLWIVADHGYRPERVGWIVLLVLAGSAAYFWRWVRVVGFKPKNKDTIRPIGLTFLFDRLLPAYQIRAENHDIDKFFRRARTVGRGKVLAPEDAHATMMQGRWRRIPVVEANAKDVERVERFLDRIKAVGLVLAIFLVAAINALVRQ
jgi:hypothetical protein